MMHGQKKHQRNTCLSMYLRNFLSNSPASSSKTLSATISYCQANCLPTTPEYNGLVCRLIVHYSMHNSAPVAYVFQET